MSLETTTKIASAIALVRAEFTNPVVLPEKGRKVFNCFLHDQFGRTADDAWKEAVVAEKIEDDEDFSSAEYFITPAGPMVAVHRKDYPHQVLVVVNAEAAR